MSKVAITIYGREYFVNCDPGDEERLNEVVKIVETRVRKIAERAGPTITDHRLFMLSCLGLADELYDLRQSGERRQRQEEDIMVAAVDHLNQRIEHIASMVGRA
jgi:cell division protein ZapA (FtsZ GTPase activity inhibitor)